jgi:hypothetical protein
MSVADRRQQQTCSACQISYPNADQPGDELCPGCSAVFRAARTLITHEVVAEEELIPTLVFARISGRAQDEHYTEHYSSGYGPGEDVVLAGDHPSLEIVRFLDKVPIVRVRPFTVTAERHPGTQVLKQVRIRTLSRKVKSAGVARDYEQLLKEEGAQWTENNRGTFSYDCLLGYLELVVAEGSELSPQVIEGLGEDLFRHPGFHFPPPNIVEGTHAAMKTAFANRLDFYGKAHRKTPDKLIPAFAAWHVGERAGEEVPPAARPRVSMVLNRHLLEPCGLPQLPESTWDSADTVWRDAKQLWPRFINIQQYAFYPSHRS